MKNIFQNLSETEKEDLKNAISWITLLIAGADGNIDPKEISWAEKLTQIRSYKVPTELSAYYQEVGKDFHERVHELIDSLPENTEDRTKVLSDRLAALNSVLPKLENSTAAELYSSFTSFAKHVAKASGGFLRFFNISYKEKSLMDLPMIHPIHREGEDD